jgi:hypothetical protein
VIAQVTYFSGDSPMGENPERLLDICDEAANASGSLQLLVLRDPQTNAGIAIHVWRDEAALAAHTAKRVELSERAVDVGGVIGASREYEVAYKSPPPSDR